MAQRLGHGQVSVVELHVFAHQTDGDGFFQPVNPVHQGPPLVQLGRPGP